MSGSSGQFLTNSKVYIPGLGEVRGCRAYQDDYFTLSFFNDLREGNRPIGYRTDRIFKSGGTAISKYYMTSATGSTATWMQHIGIGPANLSITSSASKFAISDNPNFETDLYYSVALCYEGNNVGSSSAASETYYVLLDDSCSKYPIRRFIFQNRRGQAEHLTFTQVSKESVNSTNDKYNRVLDYNYQVGQRSASITDIRAKKAMKVTSNWITDSENIQVEEFLTSPEIYLLDSSNQLLPYNVITSSLAIKTQAVDKLIMYEFDVEPAQMINTQRVGNQRTTASGGNSGGGGGVPIGDFTSTT
jgi:hypothetical protein